jgi:energy-coupling factor transport system substrate-specific component
MCRPVVRLLGGPGRRGEVAVLALFGAAWGLLYGVVMNIWFWPYATGPATMYWEPGITVVEVVQRYAVFYLVTSLVWDLAAAAGNLILISVVGRTVLRVLRRFQARFAFSYEPVARLGERVSG